MVNDYHLKESIIDKIAICFFQEVRNKNLIPKMTELFLSPKCECYDIDRTQNYSLKCAKTKKTPSP
jgi:hypothetical protein